MNVKNDSMNVKKWPCESLSHFFTFSNLPDGRLCKQQCQSLNLGRLRRLGSWWVQFWACWVWAYLENPCGDVWRHDFGAQEQILGRRKRIERFSGTHGLWSLGKRCEAILSVIQICIFTNESLLKTVVHKLLFPAPHHMGNVKHFLGPRSSVQQGFQPYR